MNSYYEFLEKLLKDFRSSSYEMEKIYGIKGFSVKMSELKKNPDRKLTQKSIADIETVLNIKVDDSDPENITYRKIEQKNPIPFEGAISAVDIPLLGVVYAGDPTQLDHELYDETMPVLNPPKNHKLFGLRVNGKSMETTLRDGDKVVIDMDAPLEEGCLVAVKLKNGNQYIKRFHDLNYAFVQLTSDNPEYGQRLIDKNDIIACFRVIAIHFGL